MLLWGTGYAFTAAGVLDPPRDSYRSQRPPEREGRARHDQGRLGSRLAGASPPRGQPRHSRPPTATCTTPRLSDITFSSTVSTHRSSPATIAVAIRLAGSLSLASWARRSNCTAKRLARACGSAGGREIHRRRHHFHRRILHAAEHPLLSRCWRFLRSQAASTTHLSTPARRVCASARAGSSGASPAPWSVNLNDHSYTGILDVSRWFGNHFSAYVHMEAPRGSAASEYGAAPYVAATSAGVRFQL